MREIIAIQSYQQEFACMVKTRCCGVNLFFIEPIELMQTQFA